MNKESCFFHAPKRLDILLSGSAHDIFAADAFYHQSCRIKFSTNPVKLPSKNNLQKNKAKDMLDLFIYQIKTKIIGHKEALIT